MRAHRGRPGPTVLLVGDAADIGALRVLLAAVPQDAYGQVYVEVASALQVETLERPARVAVTWLVRERFEAGLPARGELLVRAVDAWVSEWLPAADPRRIVWVGCTASPWVGERYRALQPEPAAAGLPWGDAD